MGFAKKMQKESLTLLKDTLGPSENLDTYLDVIRVGTETLSGRDFGVVGLTETRIIYVGRTMVGVRSQMEWQLQKLDGIEAEKTLLSQHIEVNAGGVITQFLVDYDDAKIFVTKARQKTSTLGGGEVYDREVVTKTNLVESIEKLGSLFERKLLTEDEYLAAKKKLLED